MNKQITISRLSDLDPLRQEVDQAAGRAVENLRSLLREGRPLDVLAALKFDQVGFDPLQLRPLNLIEQINQTFTYLASLEGVEYLLETHPDHVPFRLNLGTSSGFDIQSADGSILCEVFAAVRPQNNRKLDKDAKRLHEATCSHKYVFFCCPGVPPEERPSKYDDVTVISVKGCYTA